MTGESSTEASGQSNREQEVDSLLLAGSAVPMTRRLHFGDDIGRVAQPPLHSMCVWDRSTIRSQFEPASFVSRKHCDCG